MIDAINDAIKLKSTKVNLPEINNLSEKLKSISNEVDNKFNDYCNNLKILINADTIKGIAPVKLTDAMTNVLSNCEEFKTDSLALAKILDDLVAEVERIESEGKTILEDLFSVDPTEFGAASAITAAGSSAVINEVFDTVGDFFKQKFGTGSSEITNGNSSGSASSGTTTTTPSQEKIPETKPAEPKPEAKPAAPKPETQTENKATYTKIKNTNQLESFDPKASNVEPMGNFKLTAYCSCAKCCGKWAANRPVDANGQQIVTTASGARAYANKTIAVDPKVIPYGSTVIIERNGKFYEYIAQDTGGAIKNNKIDVYFDSHSDALNFGVQSGNIYVIKK